MPPTLMICPTFRLLLDRNSFFVQHFPRPLVLVLTYLRSSVVRDSTFLSVVLITVDIGSENANFDVGVVSASGWQS